jgi:hypothetical protein
MKISYKGNVVIIHYDAGETPTPIRLADGYSFDTIAIIGAANLTEIYRGITFVLGMPMRFPPVNSKSPCTLYPVVSDNTKSAYVRILIMKFGQIPDTHYFDKAFEPILVVGDDGNEYNVIPSDQFK